MKILLLSDCYAPTVNGVVSSVTTLRGGLLARGHDVRVLASGPRWSTSFDGEVYRLGSLGVGTLYPSMRVGTPVHRGVLTQLRRWRPDVLHTHSEFVTFMWARRLAHQLGIPHVHTYHTVYEDYTHYFSPSKRFGKALVARLSRSALAASDLVVAPTPKVAALLGGYGVPTPIRVIPTGIDVRRFASAPGDPGLRARLGLDGSAPVVVFVGRLAREKNLTETLNLLAASRHLDWRGLIVGDGPYAGPLRSLTRQLGLEERIVFTGAVDPGRVADYYRLGDVFVSSSRSETQGLTYVEALASGLPVLCRDDPVLDGLVADGVNGFRYVTAGDFARGFTQLMTQPQLRAEFSRQASASAGRFSAQTYVDAALEAYAAACQRPGGSPVPVGDAA